MTYTEIIPKTALVGSIERIWISDYTDDNKGNQFTFADGYSEIVFKFRDACDGLSPDHLDGKYLVGEKTKYREFEVHRGDIFIGVKFRPGYLYPFLRMPMHEFTDKSVLLDLINDKLFSDLDNYNGRFSFCNSIQNKLLNLIGNPDPAIRKTVDLIISMKGNIDIDELTGKVSIHPRNLERKFKYHVGVSPKKLCRLIRCGHVSRKIMSSDNINLTDLALSAGYSDQAHFNHEFREFTGFSPSDIYSGLEKPRIISCHQR